MNDTDPWLKAGLRARAMRESLGHAWLAADEIIRSMRALREALPKPEDRPAALPVKPPADPDN